MSIAHYNKKETSTHTYKNLFYEVSNKLSNHIHIYTDASKTDNGVGVVAVIQQTDLSEMLSDYCSIYSAKALAIY
jgi:translation initiation factor 1 (eIF-1/SUI1)